MITPMDVYSERKLNEPASDSNVQNRYNTLTIGVRAEHWQRGNMKISLLADYPEENAPF